MFFDNSFTKMYISHILILSIHLFLHTSATCFYPNGSADAVGNQGPCNTSGHSMCCLLHPRANENADVCRSDGLCIPSTNSQIFRDTCTDPTWKDPACLRLCLTGKGIWTSISYPSFYTRFLSHFLKMLTSSASQMILVTQAPQPICPSPPAPTALSAVASPAAGKSPTKQPIAATAVKASSSTMGKSSARTPPPRLQRLKPPPVAQR